MNGSPSTALVTGAAGFIGYHLARRLLDDGHHVVGFDSLNAYYDPRLKHDRLAQITGHAGFDFVEADLADQVAVDAVMAEHRPDLVFHLGAQAGVRYSLTDPRAYVSANLVGTANLIEAARHNPPRHLLIASTSSVYGGNPEMPFAETHRTDYPLSLYSATKKAGEAMAHSYAHLFAIPTTCFRFFTVYGPWGRPDMALFKFVAAVLEERPIDIYGHGQMRRDFTYIDDLVDGIVRLAARPPVVGDSVGDADSLSPVAPFRTVNIAGGDPVGLMEFVQAIETALGRTAQKNFLPMQPGDVTETFADPTLLRDLTGHLPHVPVAEGVARFVAWYVDYIARRTPA